MNDAPELVYLEPDDEITTAVRRVRASDARRVVVVAPGRSRATSSAIALRLLARTAEASEREVAVVGDPLTRSLAGEAGLAAYASVEDARRAVPATDASPEPRHAVIRVVRGAGAEETAPTMAAAAPVAADALHETRTRPIVRRPAARASPAGAGRGRRGRSLGVATLLALLAALLVAGIVAGAAFLPAATITIVPRTEPVEAAYEIVVADPEPLSGMVEATATVVATGEYEIVEPATGVVTFRNYNIGTVEIEAGTLVAAGQQAFETTEAVSVPSGSLTAEEMIAPGEEDAPVVATAPGPDANVPAGAIDTVLSQGAAARLRGFPQNTRPLVLNAEPTSGGVDMRGPEITEADVEAAVEALRADLRRLAADARPDGADLLVVDAPAAEPSIELPEGLAGTRDEPEIEVDGSLGWAVLLVDLDEVEAEAAARLADDPAVPAGSDLIESATTVRLGEPRIDGDDAVVPATAVGRAASRVSRQAILDRVLGRPADEAHLALADLGEARVSLWPGWVSSVPELAWRVDIRIEATEP